MLSTWNVYVCQIIFVFCFYEGQYLPLAIYQIIFSFFVVDFNPYYFQESCTWSNSSVVEYEWYEIVQLRKKSKCRPFFHIFFLHMYANTYPCHWYILITEYSNTVSANCFQNTSFLYNYLTIFWWIYISLAPKATFIRKKIKCIFF